MSNIDDFKAKLSGGGARANQFKVICNFPAFAQGDTELASFMIKGAQLPSDAIPPIEVPFRGGKKLKIPGDRTVEPMTLTVINDVSMDIRNAFERWMNYITAHKQNAGASNITEFMTDMTIQQLDKNENVVKSYDLIGCWPSNVAAIDLNFDTTDAIEEFTVEVSYNYWTASTTDS